MLRKLKRLALSSLNYNLKLKSASGSLTIPVINDVGRAHLDEHGPHMEALLKRFYTSGTLLIDVGVNIGQTLIKFVSVAGRGGRYLGFEPNANAASYVEEIISRNGLENAMVVPVGLGSFTRMASLLVTGAGTVDPGASINPDVRDPDFYGTAKAVAVFNGDDVLRDLAIASGSMIVKIDVEGAELEVLTGLTKTLADARPLVILEILPPSGFSAQVNAYRVDQAARLKQFMIERGYKVFAVGLRGELGMGVAPSNDYFFVPLERERDLIGSGSLAVFSGD